MGRVKKIQIDEFEEVFGRNWRPVILVGDALPGFTKSIPANCFIASGAISAMGIYHSDKVSGQLIGGIDVYRDSPDDPVALNKDWYAVIASGEDSATLLVDGPLKDSEHWIDKIPERYVGAEIIGSLTDPQE